MLNQLIKSDSIFLGEGKAILIEEFGKDYGIYFSILSAIARGKTSRSEIENVVGKEIGGYLTKLENEYEVISKKQPIFEKSSTKNVRYTIEDNFFTFWFRFIYKYNYMLENENYDPELLNSKIAVFTRATGEFKNYALTQKGVSLGDM